MHNRSSFLRLKLIIALVLAAVCDSSAFAQDQNVYTDSLQNGWENWSWASVILNTSNPVYGGGSSIAVTSTGNWQALYLHHAAFPTSGYTHVSFWIHGGSAGGQQLQVQATSGGNSSVAVSLDPLAAGTWRQVTIPLSSLGMSADSSMDGFWIQDRVGAAQAVYYVDDIKLIAGVNPPGPSTNVTIQVDAAANRHPISPLIYGTAFATTAQLLELRAPINRTGGNTTTRYNWQLNADNKGNDWYFQSIGGSSSVPGADADAFFQDTRSGGAEPILTIPIIDWVAKLGPNRAKLASFSIAKYGAQSGNDWQWFPDAGNGIKTNGQYVTGNDKNDANTPNSVAFQGSWVDHLLSRWGSSSANGLRYYTLDNEHSIWFSTHRDVHPDGPTMDEMWAKMRDYSAMIKAKDAGAQVLGPEEWGWSGFLYSGYDQQYAPNHNWTYPDRAAHGNLDYMPWLLQQFKNYETQNGRRLLDIFTLHYYPQGGEFSDDVSSAMQLRRNRSTRSLWDPNYTDETWINDKVKLVPRMKAWVAQYYPNTRIGLTEYNWGAENHINGATTQADIYGILGREGMDVATRWTTPATGSPVFTAMKMYRNYDGNGGSFGETSVAATVPNPDEVSSFASVRNSDGALTVMVVNKATTAANTTINLANFVSSGPVQVWQLTSANQISRLADTAVTNNAITLGVPAQSITLLVLAPAQIASPSGLTGVRVGNVIALRWVDNSSDEDSFAVERAVGATGNFVEVFRSSANQTSYRAVMKTGGASFRVRAVKAGQLSGASNQVQLGR